MEIEEEVENQLLKLVARLVHLAAAAFVAGIMAAAGVGGFLARVDSRISNIEDDVSEVKGVFVSGMDSRVRALELQVSKGILPGSEKHIDKLSDQLDALKSEIRKHHDMLEHERSHPKR